MSNEKLMTEKLLLEKYELLRNIRDIYESRKGKTALELSNALNRYQSKLVSVNERLGIEESRCLIK